MPTAYGSRFASHRAELLERVSKIGFFQHLTDDERQQLLVHGRVRNFKEGESVFDEGDKGGSLFFLLSGNVEIVLKGFSQERKVATLGVADIFGEMSLVDNLPRSATARAKGPVAALEVSFENELPEPELTAKILMHISRSLSRKLRHINKVLIENTP